MDLEDNRYCAQELIFFDHRVGFGLNILQKKLNPSNFVSFTSQGRPGVDTILKTGKFYVWSVRKLSEELLRWDSKQLKVVKKVPTELVTCTFFYQQKELPKFESKK